MSFSFDVCSIALMIFLIIPLKCSMESTQNDFHEVSDEEMVVINSYLEKYANAELFNQVQECVQTVRETYIESVTNLSWTNNLEEIMQILPGTVQTKIGAEFLLKTNQDFILGSGSYGVILKKSRRLSDFFNVMKISLGRYSSHNPIDEEEMPFEYCLGLHSLTTHILRPLPDSFQPIELPGSIFENKFTMSRFKLEFYYPVSEPIGEEPIYAPVVPMFEMPLCQIVRWTQIKFSERIFFELLDAVDDIHESGIALMDLSSNNLMNCNGEFKFIDLGFALLYSNMPTISFGNEDYRSPWAHIASKLETEKHPELHLDRKLNLEAIANDYWSLAIIFGRKLCDFDENMILQTHTEEIIQSKSFKYGNYSDFSAIEINKSLQRYLDEFFSQFKISNNPSCSKPLQEMLQIVLQVNPIIRMQNVETILSTYE